MTASLTGFIHERPDIGLEMTYELMSMGRRHDIARGKLWAYIMPVIYIVTGTLSHSRHNSLVLRVVRRQHRLMEFINSRLLTCFYLKELGHSSWLPSKCPNIWWGGARIDAADTDQFNSVSVRNGEVPGAVLATRVIVRPVRTADVTNHRSHLVLTAGCTRHIIHARPLNNSTNPPSLAASK